MLDSGRKHINRKEVLEPKKKKNKKKTEELDGKYSKKHLNPTILYN